ncbi:MBL fold metallo-hydrolase RNA specificity domain-containing protein [Alishewanella sp. SMS8]|uniref:MBL fold metallo-hydrolase RNA specificity domain-containing protein n=1 Tax=Alishewanella sp. SMS8 TaxID=2994676 RepID=UPI0027417770|nr:MBL fold metallo-hydrolase [Alishewanella sp. SMS8]MDP5460142.1 MBL fold metallo-hydrolase [Alishewanella sp. SMS8]
MTKLAFPPTFIHHGAVDGVTGSCHEYQLAADYAVLIDCGLFQGDEQGSGSNKANLAIQFPIHHIQALIVTHVHIDHVGRIPYLLAAGFKGPIYCSEASAHLLPLVLEDALKVGVTRDEKLIAGFLRAIGRQLVPCKFKQWLNLPTLEGEVVAQFRLQKAGHILGSAYAEIKHQVANKPFITVFSGDLGAPYSPLLPAPKPPYAADIVVLESTYGDKLHDDRRHRIKRLQQVLLHALQDNGTVLFPAFSIGRTQELLYELEALIFKLKDQPIHQQLRWQDLTIIVDSPLAAKFNVAYQQLAPFWDAEAKQRLHSGRHPLSFAQLHTIDSHAEHLAAVNLLASTGKPAIVIAASGMCEGGRVVNYLKALLGSRIHQIVFVGYQARGTLGAAIQQYGPRGGYVMIDGKRVDIQAEVLTLSGYSAHADKKGLVQFIKGMRRRPRQVRIVHGDVAAKLALQSALAAYVEDVVIAE